MINEYNFLKHFGGGFTYQSMQEMPNIKYQLLLKCAAEQNKREEREANKAAVSAQGGTIANFAINNTTTTTGDNQ